MPQDTNGTIYVKLHLPLVPHMSVNEVSIGSDNGLRLLGAKPLSKPMLGYRQLDTWKQTSVQF